MQLWALNKFVGNAFFGFLAKIKYCCLPKKKKKNEKEKMIKFLFNAQSKPLTSENEITQVVMDWAKYKITPNKEEASFHFPERKMLYVKRN